MRAAETPSPAPDRLTALIDEVERVWKLDWSEGPDRDLLAALRAAAASVEERLARAEKENRENLQFVWDALDNDDDDEAFRHVKDQLDLLDAREYVRTAAAARATTPEGNHAK